jgi:hypothetical protein
MKFTVGEEGPMPTGLENTVGNIRPVRPDIKCGMALVRHAAPRKNEMSVSQCIVCSEVTGSLSVRLDLQQREVHIVKDFLK